MREHLPWLSQGDIFSDIPVVTVKLSSTGDPEADFPRGPAVLLDHDEQALRSLLEQWAPRQSERRQIAERPPAATGKMA